MTAWRFAVKSNPANGWFGDYIRLLPLFLLLGMNLGMTNIMLGEWSTKWISSNFGKLCELKAILFYGICVYGHL